MMNTKRLLRLAKFLHEEVPPEKFDMGYWVFEKPLSDWAEPAINGRDFTIHNCGTSACALGWATEIPEFREAGLRYSPPLAEIVYDSSTGFIDDSISAAMKFFDLSMREAAHIFYGNKYFGYLSSESKNLPKERVAERIENLVRDYLDDLECVK